MFGYLKGKVISIKNSESIIDVSGVGYRVNLIGFDAHLGNEIECFVYTSVSENNISLYGFGNDKDLELFEELISISGIGPKKASGIMSKMSTSDFIHSILARDYVHLKSAGITGKTAEKLVIELSDRFTKLGFDIDSKINIESSTYMDVFEALSTLGYKKNEIDRAMKNIGDIQDMQSDDLIKTVLKILKK